MWKRSEKIYPWHDSNPLKSFSTVTCFLSVLQIQTPKVQPETVWKAVLLSKCLLLYHWLSSGIAKNGKTDQFFRKEWNPQILFWTDKELGLCLWRRQKKTFKKFDTKISETDQEERMADWSIILLFFYLLVFKGPSEETTAILGYSLLTTVTAHVTLLLLLQGVSKLLTILVKTERKMWCCLLRSEYRKVWFSLFFFSCWVVIISIAGSAESCSFMVPLHPVDAEDCSEA